ncbi:sigma-70 family RNA polymerase sigma factor [bacterium]|nr:sigma-70 family RNA polymerase sigma factor [bacterium]
MPPKRKETSELYERYLDDPMGYISKITSQLMRRLGVSPKLFDEYLAAAYIGLVDAAERYDPTSNAAFVTYAYYRIRGAIIDSIRRDAGVNKLDYAALRALKASDCIASDLCSVLPKISGRDVDARLALVLERAAKGGYLFRLAYSEVEADIVRDARHASIEERLEVLRRKEELHRAISTLEDRERIVIRAYYFEDLTFEEIATKRLRVSRSWISRIHSSALEKLAYYYEACEEPRVPYRRQKTGKPYAVEEA